MSDDDEITDADIRKHSIAAALGGFIAGLLTFGMGVGIIFAFVAFLMYNYHMTRKQKLQQFKATGTDTIRDPITSEQELKAELHHFAEIEFKSSDPHIASLRTELIHTSASIDLSDKEKSKWVDWFIRQNILHQNGQLSDESYCRVLKDYQDKLQDIT